MDINPTVTTLEGSPGGEGTFLQCLEPKEAADYAEPRALLALQTLEPPPPVRSTLCPQQGPAKGPRSQL